MPGLTWTNERRKLRDLEPWARNPRQIKQPEAKRLAESFDQFGQVETLAVGPGGQVYNGHQRLNVLLAQHGPEYEVEVRVASRALTEKEREKLTVLLHKGAAGEWNFDLLSEWDMPDLLEWGFSEAELTGIDFASGQEAEADDTYTHSIEAPIYTPKGDKPGIKDLFDDTRTKSLIAEIDAADLPESEKDFLRIAAQRHTVLNFKRIAEYYAHSSANTQRLMENSALVIIDFNRAIELGYVRLAEAIAAQYGVDHGDD